MKLAQRVANKGIFPLLGVSRPLTAFREQGRAASGRRCHSLLRVGQPGSETVSVAPRLRPKRPRAGHCAGHSMHFYRKGALIVSEISLARTAAGGVSHNGSNWCGAVRTCIALFRAV